MKKIIGYLGVGLRNCFGLQLPLPWFLAGLQDFATLVKTVK